jgi:hypothetical protein
MEIAFSMIGTHVAVTIQLAVETRRDGPVHLL